MVRSRLQHDFFTVSGFTSGPVRWNTPWQFRGRHRYGGANEMPREVQYACPSGGYADLVKYCGEV